MTWAEKYKEQAKNKEHFKEMTDFFEGAEDQIQISEMAVIFVLSPQYERSDICLALKAVERDKGWRP